jgi:transaldolase / glucose-6-phosphate isomerase
LVWRCPDLSTLTEVNPRLKALTEAGVSIWVDHLRRSLVTSGEFARMIAVDCVSGATTNPSSFQQAILGSSDYDEDLLAMAGDQRDATSIYQEMAITDGQLAADELADLYRVSHRHDGFVSLQVSPELAHDTEATLAEAHAYWERLQHPNLMIKIPATVEGLRAAEEAIYEGINVNLTLVFEVSTYGKAAEAYLRGLERRLRDGKPLDVRSVTSFFVSRIDTVVDRQLEQLGHPELAGKAGIASARAVYRRFKQIFAGGRWEALRHAGAIVQRPVWASTGVTDSRYPDTMYVDELIAPHVVNTMPIATLMAVAERGKVRGPTAERDPSDDLRGLERAGIHLDVIGRQLLVDGINSFRDAIGDLLAGIEVRRDAVRTGRPPSIQSSLSGELVEAVAQRVKRAVDEHVAERVWRRDPSLWGEPVSAEIADRLGWLTVSETMLQQADELHAFAQRCRADGFTDAVLLGMGGSSLGPEVIRRSFGVIPGGLRLHVLDSTHPNAVLALQESIHLEKTLFIVSSKSGQTIETLSHYRHFAAIAPPEQFVAITDPGSPLATLATENGFRKQYLNPPDIGGRYSVMSLFGLVPAALMGVNIEALLHRCQVAERSCAHYDSSGSNSGLWLGAVVGELTRVGRDKLTLLISPRIASLGLWVEQLVAESTGKRGRGIVPVADEPLAAPEAYGSDRLIVYVRNADDPLEDMDEEVARLAEAGHATLTLTADGPADLGRIFFLAEFAIAVAGWALEVNPFDQPTVQEAKDTTQRVLESGTVPEVADVSDAELRALLLDAGPPNYVAILGFLPPSERLDEAVTELRGVIRSSSRAAVTFGYGPRYLHSTGQLHKGGPPTGRFLQLVDEPSRDTDIPGAGYSFGTLIRAQAAGDLETLRAHGLPAERIKLSGDPATAVRALTERISGLLE